MSDEEFMAARKALKLVRDIQKHCFGRGAGRAADVGGGSKVSRSIHVKGFMPPDERYQQMMEVWHACVWAGIDVPEEVERFFHWAPPDPQGIEVELPLRQWKGNDAEGYELDVATIPQSVRVLRFYVSY